jgi:hypothetical protein
MGLLVRGGARRRLFVYFRFWSSFFVLIQKRTECKQGNQHAQSMARR